MNTAFGALFVLMANVAWLTGQATTGPWYDASVSLQVYSLALGIGVALVLSVVVLSTVRIAALDAQIRHVGDRISGAKRSSSAEESSARERGSPSDAS